MLNSTDYSTKWKSTLVGKHCGEWLTDPSDQKNWSIKLLHPDYWFVKLCSLTTILLVCTAWHRFPPCNSVQSIYCMSPFFSLYIFCSIWTKCSQNDHTIMLHILAILNFLSCVRTNIHSWQTCTIAVARGPHWIPHVCGQFRNQKCLAINFHPSGHLLPFWLRPILF